MDPASITAAAVLIREGYRIIRDAANSMAASDREAALKASSRLRELADKIAESVPGPGEDVRREGR